MATALHTVPPTGDRTMPSDHQPGVERILDGETHTVRVELGHWLHEALKDMIRTLDDYPRLRALLVAELVTPAHTERTLRRARITDDIVQAMTRAGHTSHDMDAVQADDLADALAEAALEASICQHDGFDGACPNLTDELFCAVHDGSPA